ncbi:MAG TPA: O-antigen ligase family protein [Bryobacteraceae bacterium]|jgi:O-antigen ligase
MMLAGAFAAVLWYGLLVLRVEPRWALSVFEILVLGMAAVVLVRRRFAVGLHPVGVVLAAAAVWAVLQGWAGISVNAERSYEAALGWAVNCAAFSVALAASRRAEIRARFLTGQTLFALGLAVAALIWLYTAGVLGPFAYKNQFAAYLECTMGWALAAAIQDRKRSFAWMLVSAAMLAAVVAGGSRAGSVLCLAELVVLPVIAWRRGWIDGRRLMRVAATALVAGAVLVEVAGWETIWRRLQEPNPYAVRADLLRSSMEMVRDRPLAGFGMGTWPAAYPAYARFDDGSFVNQAHNDWAQWAVEGGVPFLLAMAAVVAMLARPAFRSLWGLGLMAVFVHAGIDYPFQQRPALAAFFFAMAGVLAAEVPALTLGATSSPEPGRRREPSSVTAPSEN